jgi:glycosyltransferase involved in cell wall biosynthesis
VTNRANVNPHITVIVPAYNEAAILSTVSNIAHHLQQLSPKWDVVVIDDGSRDKTAEVVRSLPIELNATLVRFSRNFGKEYAITAGLEMQLAIS